MGQSNGNENGLDYTSVTNTVATTPKILFVKTAAIIENPFVIGKNSNPLLSGGKKKIFVRVYQYCNMFGHIRPKCFEYKNTFRMSRMLKSSYKPRIAPKIKIVLKNNYVNMD